MRDAGHGGAEVESHKRGTVGPVTRHATIFPRLTRGLAVLGLAGAATGCVDRVLYLGGECGDGRLGPGDVCLSADSATQYPVGQITPLSLRGADFTGDGATDALVMGTDATGAVAGVTLINPGDGTLGEPVNAGLFGCSAHPVPGPVNAEPPTDLLVDECAESVSLFVGVGDGTFTGPASIFVGVSTRSSGLIDVTMDGAADLLVLGSLSDGLPALSVATQGATGFSGPDLLLVDRLDDAPFEPTGFGVLDAADDPRAVLIDPTRQGGVAVVESSPAGAVLRSIGLSFTPRGLTVADWDNDGTDELLVTSADTGALLTLELGVGLPAERMEETPSTVTPLMQQVTDIDNDGNLDVVMSEAGSTQLHVWLGLGDGGFQEPLALDVGLVPEQFFIADMNGDDAPDLVAIQFSAGTVTVVLSEP